MLIGSFRKPGVSVAAFAVTALLAGVATAALHAPNELLNILLAPIILAGLLYPRWAYLVMIGIAAALMFSADTHLRVLAELGGVWCQRHEYNCGDRRGLGIY
ncbi:MAG: hypothetical protein M1434_08510 [Chloroflexi bacterium]|nr:hypothetical protein [Chloroflexota bacterium]MCL5274770.1 hypothetical protein [Chloroflexota bacterium]